MTPLTHAEVDELLGAYALDALAESDRRRVEEHLADCEEHRRAAGELAAVTPRLALAVEEREPSPELRQRILDAIKQEERARSAAGSVATAPPSDHAVMPLPRADRRSRLGRLPMIAALAVAALFLVAVGIGIGRFTAGSPPSPQHLTTWTFTGNSQAAGAVAHLVYFTAEHRAVLEVTGLKPLRPGQVYELWLFKGTTPIDAGVGQAPNGTLVAPLRVDLSHYSQIATTVEPGEQPKPTTSPILVGKLG